MINNSVPSFSVLMSSFNKGKYIREAIESVLKQTFGAWELIIIDDGSSDESVEIIKEYLDDPRIRFFENPVNKGVPYTLKRMMRESRAELVGILDSDDTLYDDTLEVVVNAQIHNPQCGFFYTDFIFCDEKLNYLKDGFSRAMPSDKNNIHEVFSGTFRAYTRSAYQLTTGYDETKKYVEDRDIIFKLEEVTPFYYIKKKLYKYRVVKNSLSTNPETHIAGELNNIDAKYAAYKRRLGSEIPNLGKKQITFLLVDAMFFSLKAGDPKRLFGYFKEIVYLSPFNVLVYLWIFVRIIKFIPYRLLSLLKKIGIFKSIK